MKNFFVIAVTLYAALHVNTAHAQWGGFIDPDIIHEAGRLSTGDFGSLSMEDPSLVPGYEPPTAREIAQELIYLQNQQATLKEHGRVQGIRSSVSEAIQKAYLAEFPK